MLLRLAASDLILGLLIGGTFVRSDQFWRFQRRPRTTFQGSDQNPFPGRFGHAWTQVASILCSADSLVVVTEEMSTSSLQIIHQRFISVPIFSSGFRRVGQITSLDPHAARLLVLPCRRQSPPACLESQSDKGSTESPSRPPPKPEWHCHACP